MEALVMAGQLILGLSILVGVHEWGHMFFAKKFGMRVEKFSIGFPPKIYGKKFGETEYSIGAIPLGGFVKISGMIDESMDKEQMNQPPQPWEFRSKPAWQRLIVMLGGIIVNTITGVLIFIAVTYVYGQNYISVKNVEHGIVAHPLAQELGLQTGDKIIQINGHDFDDFDQVLGSEVLLGNNSSLTALRNGNEIEIQIPNDFTNKLIDDKGERVPFIDIRKKFTVGAVDPVGNASKGGLTKSDVIKSVENIPIQFFHEFEEVKQQFKGKVVEVRVIRNGKETTLNIEIDQDGIMGFTPEFGNLFTKKEYSLTQSVGIGTVKAFTVITENIKGFSKIFKGEVSAEKSISGPIGIAKFFGGIWIWEKFWTVTGLLSMILAFMNLLPIPALDGGHVVFLLYEMISGRKPSDKVLEYAQTIGMVLLIALMVFAFYNDIIKLF